MLSRELVECLGPSVSFTEREFAKGAFIFRQGDPTRGFFSVERGRVQLERVTVEGRRSVMHTALAGDCFAESSLFAEHYHCDAIATTTTRVVRFEKRAVLEAVRTSPDLGLRLVELLSSEVRELRSRVELASTLSARARVLQYVTRHVDPNTFTLEVRGSLKDLAAQLGLAHETLYRELAKLTEEGVLERDGARIHLSRE